MNLADIAIKRPVFTVMVSLALMVMGVMSLTRLGVDLFPDINFPIVAVTTVYPGASPEEVERLVTRPLEDSVAAINGLDRIKSFSRDSVSSIVISFKLEADIKQGAMDVREKIASVRARLPRDIEDPIINRVDANAAPILLYSVSGDAPSQEIREITEDQLKPAIETIDGVAVVNVNGGREREVQVNLSSAKLQSLNMSPAAVAQVLSAENLDVPSGRFTRDNQEVSVRAKGQFTKVEEIGQVVLPVPGPSPVRLGEVAEIVDGFKEQRLRNRLNGEPAVVFEVIKQSGTSTLSITEAVEKKLAKLTARLPPSYKVTKILDSSSYIKENTHEVEIAIVYGGAMAILIIFLFMLDWRSTLISALALPTSVVTTFWVMYMLGFTLNMMSLLALSLAIGLLIDDAVVVRENIFRHMEMGKPPMQAASDGTKEIALAVLATTLTIVAVFIPVAFTSGMIGQFFKQFGLTIAAAVMVSLFVAFTLDPMLSARLVKPIDHQQHEKDMAHWFKGPLLRFYQAMDLNYREILAWSLRHRLLVFATATLMFFGSLYMVKFMGTEFFPKADRGQFQVNIDMPAGSSIDHTDNAVKTAEKLIAENPHVVTQYSSVGIQQDPTKASIRILATDKNSRKESLLDIMEDVRKKVAKIPDMKLTITEVGFVEGVVEAPIQLNVRGDDYDVLRPLAEKVRDIVKKTPGTTDVDMNYSPGKPELQVSIDRSKAGTLGVNMATIGSGLRVALEGDTNNKLRIGDKEYPIRVRLRESDRNNVAMLESYTVPNRMGMQVKLSELVDIAPGTGPSQIERENRQRQITIVGNTIGRSLGEVVADVNAELAKLDKPEGYTMVFAGEAERMADSMKSMGIALLLGIIFIYLVLASQFESYIHPFTIMFSLPLAIVGALLSLFLTGYPLGMSTFIGIILLMGLVTKNAILLVDYTNQLREERGMDVISALLEAGPTRLRPILMTSAAMVLGMLPTAISTGSGSEFRAPMAIAVIGGVIVSTLLTLIVVPVVYTWLDRLTLRGREERRAAKKAGTEAMESSHVRPAASIPAAVPATIIGLLLAVVWGSSALAAEPSAKAPEAASPSYLVMDEASVPRNWGPERSVSLEQAFELALEKNPDLHIAQSRLEQSKLMLNRAVALLQPMVSLGANYTRNSAESVLDFGSIVEGVAAYTNYQLMANGLTVFPVPEDDSEPVVIQPLNAYGFSANASWGILNARTIPLFKATLAAIEASEEGTKFAKRELLYAVAQLYYNLYGTQQVVEVSKRVLESRQRHLKLTQVRLAAGQLSQTDIVRSEVEVAQGVRQLRESHQLVHNVAAELAVLLGLEGVELRVQAPTPRTVDTSSFEALVESALAGRPDLKSTRAQLVAARSNVLDSQLDFLPTIALTGRYNWSNAGGFSGENGTWAVGAVASLPIWDGGLKLATVKENKLKLYQTQESLNKLELQVRKEIQVAQSNVAQSQLNLAAADQELRLARRTYEAVEKSYEAGLATSLELRDAELLITSAELNRVRTNLSLELSILGLERAVGRFEPEKSKR